MGQEAPAAPAGRPPKGAMTRGKPAAGLTTSGRRVARWPRSAPAPRSTTSTTTSRSDLGRNRRRGLAGLDAGTYGGCLMADKEIEVFETTVGQVTDVLKRLGVPKERMITVIIEPDNWLTKARQG